MSVVESSNKKWASMPVQIKPLLTWVRNDPQRPDVDYLALGLQECFFISYTGKRLHFMYKNLKSIIGMEEIVRMKDLG